MSNENQNNPPGEKPDSNFYSQQIRHQQISAIVPEGVAHGTFSTGVIVLTGANEFVLDFLVRMSRPHQVAARVILPIAVVPSTINAIRENVKRYEDAFGAIPPLPKPDPNARRPSIQEIYDDLKLPDNVIAGTYANALMISHSPSEFVLDFIASFFPRSAVSSRIFLAAPKVPAMLNSLSQSFQQYQQRVNQMRQQQQQQPPQNDAADEPKPEGEDTGDQKPEN